MNVNNLHSAVQSSIDTIGLRFYLEPTKAGLPIRGTVLEKPAFHHALKTTALRLVGAFISQLGPRKQSTESQDVHIFC